MGLGASVAAFVGLAVSRGHGVLPGDLAVVLFSSLVAGWVVLPILTFSSDDLLDPSRLALLPLTRRQLLTVMGVGALVGVPPVATLLAASGLLPAVVTSPTSYVVGLVAVVLLLALCVSASRAVAALLSGLLRSRRGRDLGVALSAVVALSFQLINPLLRVVTGDGSTRGSRVGEDALHGLAAPLRWTPAGWLAAAPTQPLPTALASLAGAAVVIAVLLVVWERAVRRGLERPDRSGSRRRRETGLVPRGLWLPAGRVGALVAKDLRYLVREPKRMVALVTSIGVPVLIPLGPLLAGGGLTRSDLAPLVYVACGIALFAGLAGANRFGLDGSATWVLLASGTDPRDARRDLLAGDIAVAVVVVPVLLAFVVVVAALTGGWVHAAPALGCALALLAISTGVSAVVSVVAAYPVPERTSMFGGGNAFSGGNAGASLTAGLAIFVGMGVELALMLPLLGLLLPALLLPSTLLGILLLVVGPAYGVLIGTIARRLAAKRWAGRGPEVLALVQSAR